MNKLDQIRTFAGKVLATNRARGREPNEFIEGVIRGEVQIAEAILEILDA